MIAFGGFLELVGSAFTAPSFELFSALVRGWLCAPGRRTVTAMLSIGDPEGRRAHDAYHRLLRDGRWHMRWLWKPLAIYAVSRFCPIGKVFLDLDDTLFNKSGPCVNGAGSFRDAVRSTANRTVFALGLNLVVITLRVKAPWGGMPIALPVNVRLHRKKDELTTIQHAYNMLQELQSWLPDRDIHLCADGAYASLAEALPPRVNLTSRMRRDAALYEPPPPPTGRRGRPRTRGERLPTPAGIAEGAKRRQWRKTEYDVRGAKAVRLLYTRDVLWYHVNPKALVRLVIVRDPDGVEPDDFFFTTDLNAKPGDVASIYGGRWAIEVCFRDTKQDLGGHNPQCWKRQGPERASALSFWITTLVWCWYLDSHPSGQTWKVRPWYKRKSTPSFLDALAALRRVLWAQRISSISTPGADHTKITDALLDTLAYAA